MTIQSGRKYPKPVASAMANCGPYVILDDGGVWVLHAGDHPWWQEFPPVPGTEADTRKKKKEAG